MMVFLRGIINMMNTSKRVRTCLPRPMRRMGALAGNRHFTKFLPATAKVLDVMVSLLITRWRKERVVLNFKEIFHPQNFLISAMPRLWQKWMFLCLW